MHGKGLMGCKTVHICDWHMCTCMGCVVASALAPCWGVGPAMHEIMLQRQRTRTEIVCLVATSATYLCISPCALIGDASDANTKHAVWGGPKEMFKLCIVDVAAGKSWEGFG